MSDITGSASWRPTGHWQTHDGERLYTEAEARALFADPRDALLSQAREAQSQALSDLKWIQGLQLGNNLRASILILDASIAAIDKYKEATHGKA